MTRLKLPWSAARSAPDVVTVTARRAEDVVVAFRLAKTLPRPTSLEQIDTHSWALAGGAVVLTTSLMDGVSIDPTRDRARMDVATSWRKIAADPTDLGDGTLAFLARRHGYTGARLTTLEVVLADGRITTVDVEGTAPDTLDGIVKGGILTSVEFALDRDDLTTPQ